MTTVLKELQRTRPGYDQERHYHKLLADAYTGGGGFQGAFAKPAQHFWGPAATMYGDKYRTTTKTNQNTNQNTYLVQYPREEKKKFERRIEAAHYTNYIAPLTDLKTSYILRKQFHFEGQHEDIAGWRANMDGKGKPFEPLRALHVLRAAVFGWAPMLIDMDPMPLDENGVPREISLAEQRELGMGPRAISLFPANLTDWATDDQGEFLWAKIRTEHTLHPDPLKPPSSVTHYTLWWPEFWQKYEVKAGNQEERLIGEGEHSFGEVPIVIMQHKPNLELAVIGEPMHGDASEASRTLFNLTSEQREHLRSQVFAILVLAMKKLPEKGSISIGTENAFPIDPESRRDHMYLAPPSSCAETYEERMANTTKEIYRMARVEFVRPSGQNTSGVARRFEFAQTNRALADFGTNIAAAEQKVDRLVGRGLGVSEEDLLAERVNAPQDYDVTDLDAELDRTLQALEMNLGPTADSLLKLRVVDQMLRNVPNEQREQIEAEVMAIAQRGSAELRAALQAA